MTLPMQETVIFVDQNQKIQSSKDNELVKVVLSPTSHQIIVSHPGYFPWTKDVTIPSAGTVALSPIFVAQNTSGSIVTSNDPEYWKIKNNISANNLPTLDHPIVSSDTSVSLWVENNAILVKNAAATTTVIQPDIAIKNVAFYKNRNDAVIFSMANTVYVIEVQNEGTQNFMPIYKGTNPSFVESDANSIYIDDGTLMQVAI
jgi:hypothetical protein